MPLFHKSCHNRRDSLTGYRNCPGMDSIGRGVVRFSSTKSGAIRSFFESVTSRRSGWIFRDRDRLIRLWGKMPVLPPPADRLITFSYIHRIYGY